MKHRSDSEAAAAASGELISGSVGLALMLGPLAGARGCDQFQDFTLLLSRTAPCDLVMISVVILQLQECRRSFASEATRSHSLTKETH